MTTNIAPIEALKHIDNICKSQTAKDEFQIAQIIGMIQYEIKQALASQECDADKYLKEILYELNCDAKYAIENIKALRKQLHSQQNTFTLEEIKEIIENTRKDFNTLKDNSDYFIGGNEAFDNLLQIFEKEVK